MNKYGIIVAMQEEMKEIEKLIKDMEIVKIFDLNFKKGKINNS